MLRMLKRAKTNRRMTVVPHTPVRRGVMLAVLALLGLAAVFAGYVLGQRQSGLDRTYLGVLEDQKRAGEVEVATLKQQLVDAELVREIDQQASRSNTSSYTLSISTSDATSARPRNPRIDTGLPNAYGRFILRAQKVRVKPWGISSYRDHRFAVPRFNARICNCLFDRG